MTKVLALSYNINTPDRKLLVKCSARKSFVSMAAGVVGSSDIGPPIISEFAATLQQK